MDRIATLRRFIEQKPEDPFPRYALALELKGQGELQGAAAELHDLLKRKPDYLAAYLMLGLLQQSLGKIDAARATLQAGQAVARAQGNSHTLGELSTALEQLA
jgi:tetratricopeptide (TPR) repeat protein